MGFDILKSIRPVLELMPNVPRPNKKVPIRKRLFYTFASLALYLICTLVPLYGVQKTAGDDPMQHLRILTASSKYSLMEFGISPIVTSGMILQFLCSFGLINRNPSDPEASALFDAAQKLAGIIMTAFQAGNAIWSGEYGIRGEIGFVNAALIMTQLVSSAIVVILLDELCQNGYGIGSGISLFICTNICEMIMWRLFSFNHYSMGRGTEYEGLVIAFFHYLFTRKNKLRALRDIVFRPQLPNLCQLFSTVIVFGACVYFDQIKINIGLETTVNRARPEPFEIKLFYCSNTPPIIQSTILSQLAGFSRTIYFHWPESLATQIFGVWRSHNGMSYDYSTPVSGLIYYLTAPQSIQQTIHDPLHTIIYLIFSLSSAGFISYYYLRFSNQAPADVAEALKKQHLTLKGHREDQKRLEKTLSRYIPTAAALGGILVALLSFVADFLSAFGSGTGIILAVSIINQFTAELSKEMAGDGLIGILKNAAGAR
ncbi:preprotein translocase, SecY subunit, putative [Trichomonas vaginalis G3]|uniref:Preprotein translocase, SecY subunit, putative n=1 Tax=Trichomonas vaginalis (strain ATCC PRA-98 / G3) TaxID=412133 RepID=A2DH65_TRIV3|nr:SECY/SEC61-alpha family member family [Trichomonas vaginalis G3]EAY20375.1 preprotein translocase, SecY subunit, putative [Trichomonas vaginalis G3]KAI5530625.1 SECY/SEC61-alpha family member family [Trichomonas vaginalis G3]|eukprot:XP_001581361.1 preprotein translocase, SecY subunit [Trichomonas vaginalis G3]